MPLPGVCGAIGGIRSIFDFVGYSENVESPGTTSFTINKPSGVVSGDLLVAIMGATGGDITWTGDTDWTEALDQGAKPNLRVAYKAVTGSEGASFTFTASSAAEYVGQILAFRAASYDQIGSIVTRTGNGALAMPGITAVDGIVIAAASTADDLTSTYSVPSGMTLIKKNENMTHGVSISTWYEFVIAGATGDLTSTISTVGAGDPSAGVLIGVKPT